MGGERGRDRQTDRQTNVGKLIFQPHILSLCTTLPTSSGRTPYATYHLTIYVAWATRSRFHFSFACRSPYLIHKSILGILA